MNTEQTETTEELSRKQEFRNKCKQLKPLLLGLNCTMNELLIEGYKGETGHEDFRTFKKWKEDGYSVKKGEKGYPIWSRPINVIKAEKGITEDTEETMKFGTCYLFHEGQVERSKSYPCSLVLKLMDQDNGYPEALRIVMLKYPKIDRGELESELDQYI